MEDCFTIVSSYMFKEDLIKLSKKIMYNYIPSSIKIKTANEYQKFVRWCKLFNCTITDVCISMKNLTALSYEINYMPPSVKNVLVHNFECYYSILSLPNTVESLIIYDSNAMIPFLPRNLIHLTLGKYFTGHVFSFESNIKSICLQGYNSGTRFPCCIKLPQSIEYITVHSTFKGFIESWPLNTEYRYVYDGHNAINDGRDPFVNL